MSKIFLAAGCSYTDKSYWSLDSTAESRGGWPMWPEIVSSRMGLECINLGVSGSNNDFILNTILDSIAFYEDRIDTIAVLWTTADRLPFFYHTLLPLAELYITNLNEKSEDLDRWMKDRPAGNLVDEFFQDKGFNLDRMMKYWMNGTLRKMYELIQICNHKGYRLVMAQGPSYFSEKPFNDSNQSKKITKSMKVDPFMTSPYFSHLEKNRDKIIGWPLLPEIGGWDLDIYRSKFDNTTVSDKDFHPNRKGQEIFSELFLKKLKVYN